MVKLWAEILFKFQWQIEKLCPAIGFGPGFVSISPLNNIENGIDQAVFTLPQVFFNHFASKIQLPGFYISRTLVENGIMVFW